MRFTVPVPSSLPLLPSGFGGRNSRRRSESP
ncbi:MAG: PEP-CTERM sorting domain-containing protein [Chloroflexi bacterium CFX4]|nr:PEP-CTERM sorting domain-containing protein [Chloroflexi bacterium CFX4]MDL1922031.1 PEP-CTERM sorting domain-containing protein [Chloroflexi bacterium CFX3]